MTICRRHASEIDAQAHREGMTTLFFSGLAKAHQGITTYEEVLRPTKGDGAVRLSKSHAKPRKIKKFFVCNQLEKLDLQKGQRKNSNF
jgi:hypothetical protein